MHYEPDPPDVVAKKQAMLDQMPLYKAEPWLPDRVEERMHTAHITGTLGTVITRHRSQGNYQSYRLEHLAVRCDHCGKVSLLVSINRARAVRFKDAHDSIHGIETADICHCAAALRHVQD